MILNMIGGGAGLNFSVVGGTSQPSNPKENTIFVNTDVPIIGWGIGKYNFTPGWYMPDGYVYIDADTNSNTGRDFNALKKNEIWLEPHSAIQKVNGTWVKKTLKLYKKGAWIDGIPATLYFYNRGAIGYTDAFNTTRWDVVSFQENCIYMTGVNGEGISLLSNKPVPTAYKTMTIVGEIVSVKNSNGCVFHLSNADGSYNAAATGVHTVGPFTINIDASGITDLNCRYVKVAPGWSPACQVKIYEIYFTL